MSETEWYSDEALAKQAETDRKVKAGERLMWADMIGLLQPRVPALPHERCRHCNADARERGGVDGRFCGLCLGRGRDEDYD